MSIKLVLFFLAVALNVNAQTIELRENIVDSVKYGQSFSIRGMYNVQDKKIMILEEYYDYNLMKIFLHELGHHIWFYGGIDTTAIFNDLAGEYFSNAEVKELFADQHWRYFFGDASPAFRYIFEAFYNRK